MLYSWLITTTMKRYYITQYIAVAKVVEAHTASDAVKQFSDDLTAVYLDGNAYERDLSFGDSGQTATVEEYVDPDSKGYKVLENIGSIAGGEFVPTKHHSHA